MPRPKVSVLAKLVHTPVPLGEYRSVFGASFFCFAVAGIMSMTFVKDGWGDRGTVMFGLMGFGVVAGLGLLFKAIQMRRYGSRFGALSLVQPTRDLRQGQKLRFLLEGVADRDLTFRSYSAKLRVLELASAEGSRQGREVQEIFSCRKEWKSSQSHPAGSDFRLDLDLETSLPEGLPSAFRAVAHEVAAELQVGLELEGAEPFGIAFALPLRGRIEAEASDASEPAWTSLEGGPEGLEARLPELVKGEAQVVSVRAKDDLDLAGLELVLGWSLEGHYPEEHEVLELEPQIEKKEAHFSAKIPMAAPLAFEGKECQLTWWGRLSYRSPEGGKERLEFPLEVRGPQVAPPKQDPFQKLLG